MHKLERLIEMEQKENKQEKHAGRPITVKWSDTLHERLPGRGNKYFSDEKEKWRDYTESRVKQISTYESLEEFYRKINVDDLFIGINTWGVLLERSHEKDNEDDNGGVHYDILHRFHAKLCYLGEMIIPEDLVPKESVPMLRISAKDRY